MAFGVAKKNFDEIDRAGFGGFVKKVRDYSPLCVKFISRVVSNRARVLLNQNPYQERAAGTWCKGRLPRNFTRTTRATSGGTRAIPSSMAKRNNYTL